MHRIRQRLSGNYPLTAGALDADGDDSTISAGTVTILDGSGTAIVTDAACSVVSGDLAYSLSTEDADKLDTYTAHWTATIGGESVEYKTRFEIVGDYLFEISEIRAHDGAIFASAETYPTATLEEARVWVEQVLEDPRYGTGVALVPRGGRDTVYGDGTSFMRLSWPKVEEVYSLTEDGTAWTAEEIAALQIRGGMLYRKNSTWTKDHKYVVHYRHGYPEAPLSAKKAGLILAKEYLLQQNLSSRATSESTDVGFIRLSYASPEHPTGIPYVDQTIKSLRETTAWVG